MTAVFSLRIISGTLLGTRFQIPSLLIDEVTCAKPLAAGLLRPTNMFNPMRRPSDVYTVPATPGTLTLFPAYVKHAGDAHLGRAGNRISVPFNVETDPLRQQA